MNNNPIGILDSGVGGLSVWREIASLLPHESTIYIGDSLNAPYGKRSSEEILTLASKLIQSLNDKQVKLIVVACNTITLNGIEKLREQFPNIPLIGTVPVIKGAAVITHNKRIGLLATSSGAKSKYVKNLVSEFASDCQVTIVATDEIVPLVEKGNIDSQELKNVLSNVLAPFQKAEIDTLVLGSTHFPFVRKQIQDMVGSSVTILDSGPAIARQVVRILTNNQTLTQKDHANHLFFTTGNAEKILQTTKILLGDMIENIERVVL